MDRMRTYGLIAVVAAIVIIAAIYIQYQNSDDEPKGMLKDTQSSALIIKTSFEVGDKHNFYDSIDGTIDEFVITAKDPNNPNMYTVNYNGYVTTKSYDDIKNFIAPSPDSYKSNSQSFTKDGSVVISTKQFGDIQCDQYTVTYGQDGETAGIVHYYFDGSGILIKLDDVIPGSDYYEINSVLDDSTMVTKA